MFLNTLLFTVFLPQTPMASQRVTLTVFGLHGSAKSKHFTTNRTWSFEFGSCPGREARGPILTRTLGRGSEMAVMSQPRDHGSPRPTQVYQEVAPSSVEEDRHTRFSGPP